MKVSRLAMVGLLVAACTPSVDSDTDVGPEPGLVSPVWGYDMPNSLGQGACPVIVDGDVILGSDGGIARFDALDGSVVWWTPIAAPPRFDYGNVVVTSSSDGQNYAVGRYDGLAVVVDPDGVATKKALITDSADSSVAALTGVALAGGRLWVEFTTQRSGSRGLHEIQAYDPVTLEAATDIPRRVTPAGTTTLQPVFDGIAFGSGYEVHKSTSYVTYFDAATGETRWADSQNISFLFGSVTCDAAHQLCVGFGDDVVDMKDGTIAWRGGQWASMSAVVSTGFLFVRNEDSGRGVTAPKSVIAVDWEGRTLFVTPPSEGSHRAVLREGITSPDGHVVFFAHSDGHIAVDARDGTVIAEAHLSPGLMGYALTNVLCPVVLSRGGVVQTTGSGVLTLPYPEGVGPEGFTND